MELLDDSDRLKAEREKAQVNRNKYGGVSSEEARYGGVSSFAKASSAASPSTYGGSNSSNAAPRRTSETQQK
jgi:epsin